MAAGSDPRKYMLFAQSMIDVPESHKHYTTVHLPQDSTATGAGKD